MTQLDNPQECITPPKHESDPPDDCESCQEAGFIDQFGNSRECGTCTLWYASYESYLREIEAFEV